jgi:filamentous hemagglutinin family protein
MAQLTPDATLPINSNVRQEGNTHFIQGGTTAGSNLFHSFQEFSLPTGDTAFFDNAQNIQNILTRVTGGSISNIDGLIRANGIANLFLLNPNGIIFGSNAKLNVGGSFIGSTANNIKFADGSEFSAVKPQTMPLLSVNVPIGLQFGEKPGEIRVQGNGYNLSIAVPIFSPLIRDRNRTGLQVQQGSTLALIGGNVNIEGGTLTAEQGRIELSSVENGQVSFSPIRSGFEFDYQGIQEFGNIRLSRQGLADASGGGRIQVRGNNISLTDGSLILIQNQRGQQGGNINVNAVSSFEMAGVSPDYKFIGGLDSEASGSGTGADIAVATQHLVIQDGAAIVARSYSPGKTGSVTVNASDSIQILGVALMNPSFTSSISTTAFGAGDAGDVTVSTGQLTVGRLTFLGGGGGVSTNTFGTGRGGVVTINAAQSVKLIGQSVLSFPSNVSSNAYNAGDAGNVTINTKELTVQNGGAVSSSTVATGNAGSVTINATESVEVTGMLSKDMTSNNSLLLSSAPIVSPELRRVLRLPDRPSGDSGNLTINTPHLRVSDSANVGVSHQGTGNAGILRVNANSIFLDRGGLITAATAFGEGGNIQLQVRDLLLLRRGSRITTNARGSNNIGGNITINTNNLVTVLSENNDISADSTDFRGGNVEINTSSLFGIRFRTQNTPFSDITATGASSDLSGNVQIETPDVNPSSGLVELPLNVIDPTQFIAQGCPVNKGNSFTVTGRGGLPPLPSDSLRSQQTATVNWVTLDSQKQFSREATENFSSRIMNERVMQKVSELEQTNEIVEATGWAMDKSGSIVLTASVPTATPGIICKAPK